MSNANIQHTTRITLPILPLVYLILITTKICGVLQWGWFAVITSIIWIPIVIFTSAFLVIIIFALLAACFS